MTQDGLIGKVIQTKKDLLCFEPVDIRWYKPDDLSYERIEKSFQRSFSTAVLPKLTIGCVTNVTPCVPGPFRHIEILCDDKLIWIRVCGHDWKVIC